MRLMGLMIQAAQSHTGPISPITPIRPGPEKLAEPLIISGQLPSDFYKTNRFMTGNLMKIG